MDCGSSAAKKTSRPASGVGGPIQPSSVDYQRVSDPLSKVEERSAPPGVTAGEAFILGSHETLAGWKVVGYTRDGSRTLSSAEARGRFILDHDSAAAAQSDGPRLTATNQPPHELSR